MFNEDEFSPEFDAAKRIADAMAAKAEAFALVAILHKRAQWGWSRLTPTGLSCPVTSTPIDHEGDGFIIRAAPVLTIEAHGGGPIVIVLTRGELEALGPCPNL